MKRLLSLFGEREKRKRVALGLSILAMGLVTLFQNCGEFKANSVAGLANSQSSGDVSAPGLNNPPANPPAPNAVVQQSAAISVVTGYTGGPGSLDGPIAGARFRSATGVVTNLAGDTFIVDSRSSTVRKITSTGVVQTLAGFDLATGSTDGPGILARFHNPQSIAIDKMGFLYVADSANNAIRKIMPDGMVSTVAGFSHIAGSSDGLAAQATFNSPDGIVVDQSGNLLITDSYERTIRKITPEGVVTTYAGQVNSTTSIDGPVEKAKFMAIVRMTIDSAGNLYVIDRASIRKISIDHQVTTIAGSNDFSICNSAVDGVGPKACFYNPTSIAADINGNLFVADDNAIRKIAPDVTVTTVAGKLGTNGYTDGKGALARFGLYPKIGFDPNGNMIIADSQRIRKMTVDGTVTTISGSAAPYEVGQAPNPFAFPIVGIAADEDNNLYYNYSSNPFLYRISGSAPSVFAPITKSGQRLYEASNIAKAASGPLYIVDSANRAVFSVGSDGVASQILAQKFDSNGNLTSPIDGPIGQASVNFPVGIAIDQRKGNIFFADQGAIRKLSTDGIVSTVAGTYSIKGASDGVGALATFYTPSSLAFDSLGNLFIADGGNSTIRKMTPDGSVTTFAGQAGVVGYKDGQGSLASFNYPKAIVFDKNDNLYVADNKNALIRKITPHGDVTTIVGTPGQAGLIAGPLPGAISNPMGLAIVGSKLYITMDSAIVKVILP